MPRKNADELQNFQGRMNSRRGRDYWRSLEELAGTDEFQQYLTREFPEGADQWGQANRRQFLSLMGASLALAGLGGCIGEKAEEIVPYVKQPEEIVPGKPLFFATAMTQGGLATGLLVESHMGRPTKIEGNPRHPSVPESFWGGDPQAAPGVSDIYNQAAILGLYDPDRSQTVTRGIEVSSWNAFLSEVRPRLAAFKGDNGKGLRLLTETVTSPTLAAQIAEFRKEFPEAQWHQFEPVNRDNVLAGARMAFGDAVDTHYHLENADVILALDSDFLVEGPDHLNHAMHFANGREVNLEENPQADMNRLYVVESTRSLTGANADHRLPVTGEEVERFALALAKKLGVDVGTQEKPRLTGEMQKWVDVVAADLQRKRSGDQSSLVVVGNYASPFVHALCHAINRQLGNVGKTVTYTQPIVANPVLQYESLSRLVEDMQAGDVEMLFILGGNPAYTAPADLPFGDALAEVPLCVHLGLYEDETSALCDWHIPQTHFLESWSDARAANGTVSIIQPLIAPLYQGRTDHEVMSALLGKAAERPRDIVRNYWASQISQEEDFDAIWQNALHDGILPDTEFSTQAVSLVSDFASQTASEVERVESESESESGIGVVVRPDPTVWDGRYANNGWLQELPKPFTSITWDNAALVSPALAEEMGLRDRTVVTLEQGGRSVKAPVWVVPGHPDRTVTIHLGYGRPLAGRVGSEAGFDAYRLQTSESPWHLRGVIIRPTTEQADVASTQHHHLVESVTEPSIEDRHLVRTGTIDEWREQPEHPHFVHPEEHKYHTSFFEDEHLYDGYKWAMTIDLNRCIGCNACMLACQSENNIPIVGKDQVAMGREMHWIRVDNYYEGEPANPRTVHQPVTCMHCENAPCEIVCPVAATVHDDEGLNQMVYNRCVGTRYCSNNCPYKVRRFNFLQYSETDLPVLELLANPDVTVRDNGVMEKCTYCTQRISAARIESEKRIASGDENGQIRDGEVVTACQAVCPTQAITFGDLNTSDSRIQQKSSHPLNYAMLSELNTKPRTTYLAGLRNPNPALETSQGKAGESK